MPKFTGPSLSLSLTALFNVCASTRLRSVCVSVRHSMIIATLHTETQAGAQTHLTVQVGSLEGLPAHGERDSLHDWWHHAGGGQLYRRRG